MFDSDFWNEVFETIRRQRWRSLMTAFGVFWGMLMLVLLVGAGMGLSNGIIGSYTSIPANSLFITAKETTKPYMGLESGRLWQIKNQDANELAKAFPNTLTAVAQFCFNPIAGGSNIRWNGNTVTYDMAGVNDKAIKAVPHKVTEGRYINSIDVDEQRTVCVIGEDIRDALFGETSPIGQEIIVDGKVFRVVGVCRSTNQRLTIGVNLSASVLVPISIAQSLFGKGDVTDLMIAMLTDECDAYKEEPLIVNEIKSMHHISPEDKEAVDVFNLQEMIGQVSALFYGVNILIWIVGLGTLFAGIIGISNIMIVTVKERTQEIGVRRALGADPDHIILQIMMESLTLTTIAGLVGLAIGLAILQLLREAIAQGGPNGNFDNPYMPFVTAIVCLIVLILGGLFAGWMPARRAMKIKAIEALREE